MNISLLPISAATMFLNSEVDFSVYISDRGMQHPIKFLSEGQTVDSPRFKFLRSSPEIKVFIDDASKLAYYEYIENRESQWATDPLFPEPLKSSLKLELIHFEWQQAFPDCDWMRLAQTAMRLAREVEEFQRNYPINIVQIGQVLGRKRDELDHSLRTALYCGILAKELGFDSSDVTDAITGGLLHDIGKRKVGDDAECYYDNNERRLKAHPTIGFRRLCRVPNLPEAALMMCYQHHEMMDGSGFPTQLRDNAIHELSRVCAIVDRYENMTAHSEPAKTKTPAIAGRLLEQGYDDLFDREMLKTWLKVLREHLKHSLKMFPCK